MFLRTTLLALCLSICSMSYAEILAGNVNFLLGQQSMTDDDWEDTEVDDQILLGVNVDLQIPIPFVPGVEFGILQAQETGHIGPTDIDATVVDLFLGVNKTWSIGPAHPFIGGGITRRSADVDIEDFDDDSDADIGFYIHGGAFWRVGTKMNLGLDFRYTKAEVDIFDDSLNADSFTISAIIGIGF